MLAFFLGALSASLLLVLGERIPGHEKLRGTSHCNYCDADLKLWHVVPVASWLLLRGRTGCCRRPLPVSYLLIEGAAGLWAALWTAHPAPLTLTVAVLGVCLVLPAAYLRTVLALTEARAGELSCDQGGRRDGEQA